MPKIHIVPECFAETELVRILIANIDVLNHGDGIHQVSRILKKDDVTAYVNIGFVDSDKKNLPHYFDSFTLIEEIQFMSLKHNSETSDYLFFAKPAIEKFLLAQLDEIGKSPSDYDLPDEFPLFCKKLKKSSIQNHEGYKRMILEIKNENTSGVVFILENIEKILKMSDQNWNS